ncbi:MAG: AAA family ATPase [Lentisphaerae bacterium]|nr:AAA family ATPase [Lentisphaerota bacterium]
MNAHACITELHQRVAASIIGQDRVIERLIIALLANGNVLMEGLPGLAKTRAIKTLARHINATFSRIQFTPDLLPSDVTGTEVYDSQDGKAEFRFQPGPIFGHLILADEINRAPAKVQAALLEAMEERQVTVAGKTHKLPDLFLVLATQNPIEQEGTYPLPEAQMDRFLLHVVIRHPSDEDELAILRLVRGERSAAGPPDGVGALPQEAVFDARRAICALRPADAVERYIVALVGATRAPARFGDPLQKWIHVGASPRGTLALDIASRARAWLEGRDHVLPEDVQAVAHDCLRHRLILSYEANAEGVGADAVVDELLKQVAVA